MREMGGRAGMPCPQRQRLPMAKHELVKQDRAALVRACAHPRGIAAPPSTLACRRCQLPALKRRGAGHVKSGRRP